MIDENEPCLRLRNQTTRAEETYCKYYVKKFRGYVRCVFINYQSVGLFIAMLFVAGLLAAITHMWQDDDKFAYIIGYTLFGVALFFYVYEILKKLWFWKYAKYVVVTNEGIWIMSCSSFWWSKDFTGKKRFLSPHWSRYDWNEIKISTSDKARPRSTSKIANTFDGFDNAVIRSSHLTSLFLTRFDGVQQIDFLDDSDANEILSYAKERQKRKKRKKKDMEIITEEYDKLPDDEYVNDEE